ncbi:DUF3389 domain-containing protein [Vibrio brasiliensis]|jgi:hypothetical protein|uniref:DUF3389 domain-containing protein n=1 Tax=Vibrio brasiliensis TaxID=170652 RepID=UPI001EFEB518|nr:DUF3389 domain-containing protein [Vibrio brasiliensis]MCG9753394.1 DUF3389 domain-containing protein [Vibrio brasiliensis]MCG9783878.1 DUF3389 domain-containing protein [Vibrio brasiliensis]
MMIPFSSGKIIATAFEVVVKLEGSHMVTLQAQNDAITLIGRGANVISANGSETKWSVKLDNEQQLIELSQQISGEIQ